jgi:phage terminase large subunit GpA-like protein
MIPPRFIGTLEWAERHVVLNDVPFTSADFPWLHDIAETVDRVRGAIFIVMMPPQVFKTLYMQMRLARGVAVEPTQALWYAKTSEAVAHFADEKLSRLLEAAAPVQAKLPYDPDLRGNKKLYRFTDAPVSLLGADVREHRNSRSARDLYLDESWQYEAGSLREIFSRTDSYESSRRIIIGTTGPTIDDETDTLWQQSTRSEWRVMCPSCHAPVPCEFGEPEDPGGIKWASDEHTREPDGRWRPVVAAGTAGWVCPQCAARHRYGPELLRRMNDRLAGARYEQTNPRPNPSIYGWRAEAVCFRNWEDLCFEWLTAVNAKKLGSLELIEEFIRKKRVRAWDPMSVMHLRRDLPFGEYDLGDPWAEESVDPAGVPLRFMTVDVQQNHYWVVIRQWSAAAGSYGHSRLLHFEKIFGDGAIEDLRLRFKILANRVTLDCKYNTQSVLQICHRWGYLAVMAVEKHDFLHQDGVRRIYAAPEYVDAFQGKPQQGHAFAARVQFSSGSAKMRLDTLRGSRDAEGRPLWTIPRNAAEDYIKQAWAEILIRKRSPKGGWYYVWQRLRPDNHAFDMEATQVVCGSMIGLLGAQSLEQGSAGEEAKEGAGG